MLAVWQNLLGARPTERLGPRIGVAWRPEQKKLWFEPAMAWSTIPDLALSRLGRNFWVVARTSSVSR